jgi:hypothetical protein
MLKAPANGRKAESDLSLRAQGAWASRQILSVLIDLSDFRVMSSAWHDTLKISRKETPLFNT